MHKVSEVDTESKLGRCAICGPVAVKLRKDRNRLRWVCKTARDSQSSSRYVMHDGTVVYLARATREAMLAAQGNLCAICDREMPIPHLDHCHRTGKFRRFLCNGCNSGIGFFDDDIDRLRKAILYLEDHG